MLDLNLGSQDQESYAFPTEPASDPINCTLKQKKQHILVVAFSTQEQIDQVYFSSEAML